MVRRTIVIDATALRCALLVATLATAACATKPSAAPAPATRDARGTAPAHAESTREPSFVVRSFTPVEDAPVAPLRADDFLGAATTPREIAVIEGAREGERRTIAIEVSADGTTVLTEAGEEGVERTVLKRRADGGLTLLSVDTPSEDSRSVFEAGLAWAPDELVAGATVESASPMRVYLLSSQGERSSGRAKRTMRIVGTAAIEASGEPLEATVVETAFDARLDAARAQRRATLYIVRGRGVVAERWEERIVVLGIFPRSSSETTVALPATAAADASKDAR
jgi:hypothetical protein